MRCSRNESVFGSLRHSGIHLQTRTLDEARRGQAVRHFGNIHASRQHRLHTAHLCSISGSASAKSIWWSPHAGWHLPDPRQGSLRAGDINIIVCSGTVICQSVQLNAAQCEAAFWPPSGDDPCTRRSPAMCSQRDASTSMIYTSPLSLYAFRILHHSHFAHILALLTCERHVRQHLRMGPTWSESRYNIVQLPNCAPRCQRRLGFKSDPLRAGLPSSRRMELHTSLSGYHQRPGNGVE